MKGLPQEHLSTIFIHSFCVCESVQKICLCCFVKAQLTRSACIACTQLAIQ